MNEMCFYCGLRPHRAGGCDTCGPDAPGREVAAVPSARRPGDVVGGQYVVGRVLSRSERAIVYLAVDRDLEMPVALKEHFPAPLAHRASDGSLQPSAPELAAAFQSSLLDFAAQGRQLAKLGSHPNVVRVLSFLEEGGTALLVMAKLDGATLASHLESGRRLSEDTAVSVAVAVLDGLRAVHDAGLVHGGVGPTKVFVTRANLIQLLAFGSPPGIAGAMVDSGEHDVSAACLAPEVWSGEAGPAADVYAVGALMYLMLVGEAPPSAPARSGGVELRSLADLTHGAVSVAVCRIVARALALRPEDRYATVAAFQDALTLRGQSVPGAEALERSVAASASPERGGSDRARRGRRPGTPWWLLTTAMATVMLMLSCGGLTIVATMAAVSQVGGAPPEETPVAGPGAPSAIPPRAPPSDAAQVCDDAGATGGHELAAVAWQSCKWATAVDLYGQHAPTLRGQPGGVQQCVDERTAQVGPHLEVLRDVEEMVEEASCHSAIALLAAKAPDFGVPATCREALEACEKSELEARHAEVRASERRLDDALTGSLIENVSFTQAGSPWLWDIVVVGDWDTFRTYVQQDEESMMKAATFLTLLCGEVGEESRRTRWRSRFVVLRSPNGTCEWRMTTGDARAIHRKIKDAAAANDGALLQEAMKWTLERFQQC